MIRSIDIFEAKTKKEKSKKLFSYIVYIGLSLWAISVALSYNTYTFNLSNGYSISIVLLPMTLIGGLYGYLLAMISFLVTFIITLIIDSTFAYSLSIMMIAGLLVALFAQNYWFENILKTLVSGTITLFLTSNISSLCFFALLNNSYGFESFGKNTVIFFFRDAPVVYGSCILIYLIFTKTPDYVKSFFAIGVAYTSWFRNDTTLVKSVKKAKVSLKITLIIIFLEIALFIGGAWFNYVLYPELKDVVIRNMIDIREGKYNSENYIAETPYDIMISNIRGTNFRMSDEAIKYDIKMILLMLSLGVPLSAIINFYVKTTTGERLLMLSDYMIRFVNSADDDKKLIAKEVDDLIINSGDEIEVVNECMKDMVHEIDNYMDRVAVQQKLENDLEISRKANVAKSNFLSNMSHEIRTPINAVLGMNEMILREAEDKQIQEYALEVKNAGTNLLRIVNDILDFSKIEAGKMELVPVEYDLASVFNDLLNMIKKRAEDKGLSIRVSVDPTIPHLLYGDEIRIKQVLTNILTNAVKYTEKGGIVFSVRWKDCSLNDYNELRDDLRSKMKFNKRCICKAPITLEMSVEDTGIGIKEEDMKRIFTSFERVDEKRNRTIEGTGLGMSITTSLLDLMGSKLNVKSEYGVGSVFYFDLIQNVVDDKPIGDFSEAIKNLGQDIEKYKESFVAPEAKVLVVDDTEMNLTVFKNLLKQTQLQIDTASSGAECLDMLEQKKYDIIFLDHRMPKMDGIECLGHIRENSEGLNLNTPVIALTANAVSGSRDMYLDAGFDDYITKPIVATALEEMIIHYLPESMVQKKSLEESEDASLPLPEWIEKVPFIIGDIGRTNCGDNESYIKALEAYMDAADEMQTSINNAYSMDELKEYTIKVHALKSSSKIIGAVEIGQMAEMLEKAGNESDRETINKYTEELLLYHKTLCTVLKKYLVKDDEEIEKPLISGEQLEDAYSALKEVAQFFDYDTVQTIISSIDDYVLPDEEQSKFNEIRNAANKADWDMLNKLMEDK